MRPGAGEPQLPAELAELLPFINESGQPFTPEQLKAFGNALSGLDSRQRECARDENAEAIAQHGAERFLVVSGPGTGKSILFISRIRYWLRQFSSKRVRVATFVRKLAGDLQDDIDHDPSVSQEDKARVEVSSLHRMARQLAERNHGTADLRLRPHFRVIAQFWENIVWADVLALARFKANKFPWKTMAHALYDGAPPSDAPWDVLREIHLRVQQFYNALGFPDLILVATQVVAEDPSLVDDTLFIIDEFQDFNTAERDFIRNLTEGSDGLLIAGDDDQVLYDTLRRGHASIIRDYYEDPSFVNALLPFCSRCSVHICRTAEAFLGATTEEEKAILKLFLPIKEPTDTKVVVAAATTPEVGIDYIKEFLAEHAEQIAQRQSALKAGEGSKDAYLLILTPAGDLRFLGTAKQQLLAALAPFAQGASEYCPDYWKVRDYYALAKEPSQNFLFRKVLHHEDVQQEEVTGLLQEAMSSQRNLADLESATIAQALEHAARIREILDDRDDVTALAERIGGCLSLEDPPALSADLTRSPIGTFDEEDDTPGLGQARGASAVQLQPIVGSKGLSADHVIVLGCDQVNLSYTSRNAFFVALTRGRESLSLLASVGGGGAETLHDFVAGLPDDYVRALYLKTSGREEMPSIAALQEKLTAWAKQRAKGKVSARAKKA